MDIFTKEYYKKTLKEAKKTKSGRFYFNVALSNEFEINTFTGRDSDGNLWESDGYFSDTYHYVDEDDD